MRAMTFEEFAEQQAALVANARDAGLSIEDIVITLTGIAKGLDPDIFRDLAGAETKDAEIKDLGYQIRAAIADHRSLDPGPVKLQAAKHLRELCDQAERLKKT